MSNQHIADIATKTSLVAGTSTVAVSTVPRIFGLTIDEWTVIGIIIGAIATIGSFIVTWVYRHKALKAFMANDRRTPPEI